jgi:glycosyltransferase involved in cell wall biosynthesis
MCPTELNSVTSSSVLEALGLAHEEYVLYLGRFSPEKNCHLLIHAFEELETPMKLVLAGGSSHTDEYAASLRVHQSNRVRILDWVSGNRLDDLLANAAVFVLPSDMEGMSLALLDAMGAGVCVLASDVPENIETIGNAGFTFKSGNVHHLQHMLGLLLANPSLREKAGRRAQERVRRHYLWENVAVEMSSIYESVVRCSQKNTASAKRAFRSAI